MADPKLVQVNLMEGTLQRLGDLERMLGARNRTDAIVRAIEIAHPLVEAVTSGRTIIMEAPDGSKERFIIPGIGRLVTYYAVLHGEPGNQTFRPMRRPPGVSQLLFTYEGPEFAGEEELRADFDARFLPLMLERVDSKGHQEKCGDEKGESAFVQAEMLAKALLTQKRREWILISTKDRRLLSVLPKGERKTPMPFVVADDWCKKGAIISRLSWGTERMLVARHAKIRGAYIARLEDGTMETWTPSDADRAATDWGGLGPLPDEAD